MFTAREVRKWSSNGFDGLYVESTGEPGEASQRGAENASKWG